ncbi:MAG TPA: hypothetical protein VK137_00295, partial [Planctomycetaceae bacterium]|nr:hypothetical protein [Planctomycetaceae bacterium]
MLEYLSSRRVLLGAGLAGAAGVALGQTVRAEQNAAKGWRIGVVSASIGGKPQKTNGHTWHFAQYFHPTVNLDAIKKFLDPGSARMFEQHLRNPRENFDQLPFADTRITHVYDADRASAAMYAETFPGVV